VEIARRHGLRGGGAELALRFALLPRGSSSSSSSGRAAVFGATSVEQVRAAFAAAGVGALSKEVLEECDAVHARNPNPAP
jgi:aryl-alcohol dehydrogenase-like predicted oxidoreductase